VKTKPFPVFYDIKKTFVAWNSIVLKSLDRPDAIYELIGKTEARTLGTLEPLEQKSAEESDITAA